MPTDVNSQLTLAFLMILVFNVGCGKPSDDAATNETTTTYNFDGWEPPEEILEVLYPETRIGDYFVRSPRDYHPTSGNTPPGSKLVAFVGNRRSDGTNPMLQIMVMTPPDDAQAVELEQFLSAMLQGVERNRQNWSQTPFEEGDLNGLKCMRTRWSGTDIDSGRRMHGVMYAAVDGRTFINIHTQDVEPHHAESLAIGEASALTFRKR